MLWGKENLCLIRPLGESLALETLYFAEDIRVTRGDRRGRERDGRGRRGARDGRPARPERSQGDYDPEEFKNEYRETLRAMLEAKLAGEEIAVPEPAAPAPVIDLMEALKESVEQAKSDREPAKPAAKKSRLGRPQARRRALVATATGALPGAGRLELCLEEALVDLALVDRDRLFEAHPDHLVCDRC